MDKPIMLPSDFKINMAAILKEESETFYASLDKPTITSIRLNPFKPIKKFNNFEKVNWCGNGFYLENRPKFILDPDFHAGAYYVQESSSMFIEALIKQKLDLDENLRVLDLCAAPGGKSTHIISLINNKSLLVTNEVIKSRAIILEENIQKWGSSNVMLTNNDPEKFHLLKNYFDLVLVDAPCSGEGMFRKTPEARNEWSTANIQLCSGRQKRIISEVLSSIKPGGFLIYSTCTFNYQENEDNINWILEHFPDFQLSKIKLEKKWDVVESPSGYRFYPHRLKGEGFFASILQKKEMHFSLPRDFKPTLNYVSKKHHQELNKWLKNEEDFEFIELKGEVYAIKKCFVNDYMQLSKVLYIKSFGLNMGQIIKDKLVPSHQLALSNHISNDLQTVSVDEGNALLFLKREPFSADYKNLKGWVLVKFDTLHLGWIKILENRVNNYYPKELRIRISLNGSAA